LNHGGDNFATKTTGLTFNQIDLDIKLQFLSKNNLIKGPFHEHQNDNFRTIVLVKDGLNHQGHQVHQERRRSMLDLTTF
jgi:hypothetical protein